jgi:hypothetical protein
MERHRCQPVQHYTDAYTDADAHSNTYSNTHTDAYTYPNADSDASIWRHAAKHIVGADVRQQCTVGGCALHRQ